MPKEKKVKPKYESPVILPLGELAHGEDQCRPGTGPLAGNCDQGTNGFSECGSGGTPKTSCISGELPSGTCNTGEALNPT